VFSFYSILPLFILNYVHYLISLVNGYSLNDCREKNTRLIREAIHVRYMLLPYFYTLFREANTTGLPVMRPLWMEFPSDEITFSNDEAFMVGSSLLVQGIYTEVLLQPNIFTYFAMDLVVCPLFNIVSPLLLFNKFKFVVSSIQRAKYVSVYMPGKELWYDIRTGAAYKGGKTHKLEAKEESVPAFQRAGTIIPRKDRLRRSSTQMVNDPYTLVCS